MKKRERHLAQTLEIAAFKREHEYDAAIEIASVLDGYWREMNDPPYKNRKAFEKAVLKIVKG